MNTIVILPIFATMTKLEELLSALSDSEIKRLIHSLPDLSTDIALAGIRKTLWHYKETRDADKRVLYKIITGKKTFNDKAWRYIQTEIVDYLERFLLSDYIEKDQRLSALLKMKALQTRKCLKSATYFRHVLDNKQPYLDADHHFTEFEKLTLTPLLEGTTGKRKKDPAFQEMTHQLDSFYLTKRLQLLCEQVNYSKMMNIKTNIDNWVIELSENEAFKNVYSIEVYRNIFLSLYEADGDKYIHHVMNDFKNKSKIFKPDETIEIYTYLKNYCIRQINQGKPEYHQFLFDIYKQFLADERLIQTDYLSEFEYKNIVSISIRLNEYQWCETFIKQYINNLAPELRNNAQNYNQAYLYFHKGNFKGAIRKLQDVEFTDLVYQIDSRVILLKSYYELDEDDQFFYHASAFRLFILRNRHLSEYQKKINRNLIRFLTALRRNAGNQRKLRVIHDEILHEKNVADLNWLLQKTNELLD